jgi:hypothetical protein
MLPNTAPLGENALPLASQSGTPVRTASITPARVGVRCATTTCPRFAHRTGVVCSLAPPLWGQRGVANHAVWQIVPAHTCHGRTPSSHSASPRGPPWHCPRVSVMGWATPLATLPGQVRSLVARSPDLRVLQVFFSLRVYTALKPSPLSAHLQFTRAVRRPC